VDIGQNYHKFIAAKATGKALPANSRLYQFLGLGDRIGSKRLASSIVDLFEPIHIDHDHRQIRALVFGHCNRSVHFFVEPALDDQPVQFIDINQGIDGAATQMYPAAK